MNKINLEAIGKDISSVLEKHGLMPYAYSINITLKGEDFDLLANEHSNLINPKMIFKTTTDSSGLQWSIQILRRQEIKNFPPRIISSSSPEAKK